MPAVPKQERKGRRASSAAPGKGNAARARSSAVAVPVDFAATLAALSLVVAYAGAALAFDSGADSSFDAPKRIVCLFAVAASALAAFGLVRWENPFAGGRIRDWSDPRLPLALAGLSLVLAVASALASPHRALALDATRVILLTALLLPIGASRVVFGRRALLVTGFLGAAGIDAVVSILQARRIYQPFPLVTQAEREATGAFAGNVGYLALGLALAAVAAIGIALTSRSRSVRLAAGGLALLFVGALLVNRNLTSLTAFAAGIAVLLFGLFGRRALLPFAAAIVTAALAVSLYTPMRVRAAEALSSVRAGQWDALLSYRTAPWAAAVRMARERPLLGWGPGTFGAEFVPHRLDAEISTRRRLTSPLVSSSYGEAHCDYLQPFAEAGLVAGGAILAAAGLLVAGLARRAASARGVKRADRSDRGEAVILLALLSAGAMAAVSWFPLQRPITAVPLLLVAGRAWRVARGSVSGESS